MKTELSEQYRFVKTYTRGLVNLAKDVQKTLKRFESEHKMNPQQYETFLAVKSALAEMYIPKVDEMVAEIAGLERKVNAQRDTEDDSPFSSSPTPTP